MASSGCNFICDNNKCKHYKTGFVLYSPWQIGDIELIINDLNVIKNNDAREQLIKWKMEGRKHAIINMPNIHKIPSLGYRIQMWCNKCHIPWSYDILNPENKELDILIEEAKKNCLIPEKCVQCNETLRDFVNVVNDGIVCWACNEKLAQHSWFSNEEE